MTPTGLRDRKRLDTHKALSDATLKLALQHGLEHVRRTDIAAHAGVSLRTLSNYFPTKYDALAYRVGHRIALSAELLGGRPADEPLWTAIVESLLEPLQADWDAAPTGGSREHARALQLQATPELRAAVARAATEPLVVAVAARTGTDAHRDLQPRLVAGLALSAMQTTLEHLAASDRLDETPATLRAVFAGIAAGEPEAAPCS